MNGMISETLRYEALAEGARSLRHCVYSTPLLLCRFARGWWSYFCCYEGPKGLQDHFSWLYGNKTARWKYSGNTFLVADNAMGKRKNERKHKN